MNKILSYIKKTVNKNNFRKLHKNLLKVLTTKKHCGKFSVRIEYHK